MTFLTIILLSFFSASAIAQNVGSVNNAGSPLDLTAYLERGETDKARKLSAVDPTLFAGVQSHAAFFNVNKTNKWHNFFWFFPVENRPLNSTPWIIWLGSGMGYTALYGLFTELGPLKLENETVTRMPDTWHSDYSLLYIDTPVHAGFSYSETKYKFVKNDEQGGECLVSFIQQFVQVFPELQTTPLFVAGELFGARFGLAMGRQLHYGPKSSIPINLKGFLITGNWIDPPSLLHYSDLAKQLGLMTFGEVAQLRSLEYAARNAWKEGNITEYLLKYADVNMMIFEHTPYKLNAFKYTENFFLSKDYLKILNQPNIRSALHVGDLRHELANYDVLRSLRHVLRLSAKPCFEDLLEHYGILCYSGQLGFKTGYVLAEYMYQDLHWSGQQEYLKAPRTAIPSKNKKSLDPIGYVKGAGNFMEAMVRAAGDVVPTGQPAAVKQLIDMFIDKFK